MPSHYFNHYRRLKCYIHFSLSTRVLILRSHYPPGLYNTVYLKTVPQENYSSPGEMLQLSRIVSQKIPIESYFKISIWQISISISGDFKDRVFSLLRASQITIPLSLNGAKTNGTKDKEH